MIRFHRTEDLDIVRGLLADPCVYPTIGDDFAPPREQFQPNTDPRIWYVLAICGRATLGVFTLLPESPVCVELHVAMLPEAWGPLAQAAGQAIVPWIWEHTGWRRIFARVPAWNRLALRYGTRVMGLEPCGVNPRSFQKHGQLVDQVWLGVSKPCPA